MGCPELDITSYFRLIRPTKTASRRFRRPFPTPKTACTRQPLDVRFGLRYYSASLGRWINRDPIEEKGGWNLYAMCNNDTIAIIDCVGLTKVDITKSENIDVNGNNCILITVIVIEPPEKGWRLNFIQFKQTIYNETKNGHNRETGWVCDDKGSYSNPPFYYNTAGLKARTTVDPNKIVFSDGPGGQAWGAPEHVGTDLLTPKTYIFTLMIVEECESNPTVANLIDNRIWSIDVATKSYTYSDQPEDKSKLNRKVSSVFSNPIRKLRGGMDPLQEESYENIYFKLQIK